MSRATRPRQTPAPIVRASLAVLVCAWRDARLEPGELAALLGLPASVLRRAVKGRTLRPWQARAVALSLRGDA